MANVTISVDEEVLKQARIRALQQGTSVNAVIRDLLEGYARVSQGQLAAADDLVALARESHSRRGGRCWSRDELHERD
ncbi:hypothetical protein [Arhodomonas sp. SL1]|uniref:hypothetical protein n=1 Tax=Arhodomonas sp. SL1 TaxID=3425691 RepID=UPI003F885D08